MNMNRVCTQQGGIRNVHNILISYTKPEGKRSLERLKRRWEADEMGKKKKYTVGGCALYSSSSEKEPVASSCEHGDEHSCSIKGGKFLD
jgi:predicted nucleic acid binding AN1-type Zn finger protein